MSELRQNLATKEWVIIATERAKRPVEFVESSRKASCADAPSWDERCPFCPGNEEVDLEVMRVPSSDEPGACALWATATRRSLPAVSWSGTITG